MIFAIFFPQTEMEQSKTHVAEPRLWKESLLRKNQRQNMDDFLDDLRYGTVLGDTPTKLTFETDSFVENKENIGHLEIEEWLALMEEIFG